MAGDQDATTATSMAVSEMPKFSGGNQGRDCNGNLGTVTTGACSNGAALDRTTAAVRHLETANYLFADGHVKSQKPSQLYGAATPFTTSNNSPTFRIVG